MDRTVQNLSKIRKSKVWPEIVFLNDPKAFFAYPIQKLDFWLEKISVSILHVGFIDIALRIGGGCRKSVPI